MKRNSIVSLCAALALAATCAYAAEGQLGKVEPAKDLMGRAVHDSEGKIGDIKDLVVDLESGRILYSLVSADGKLYAVPTQAFSSSSESKVVFEGDKGKLTGAPQFDDSRNAKLNDADFAKRAYQHFGESLAWNGTFNNVHKASELIGMNVNNVSDQKVGDISNLGIDLHAGRVAYVILGSGGVLGVGDKLYVMPPNAFTLGSDNKSLVTSIDKQKLEGAPVLNQRNWSQLSDAQFASRVYQHYGKQPYWSGQLTPTGREEGETITPNSQQRISRERDRNRNRNRNDDDGLRVRRQEQAATGEFGNLEDARQLIGMTVENARGDNVGKLNDIVVDLESGRALYAVINAKGAGNMKAVAPGRLVVRANDKAIRFTGDQQKLENAPNFNRNNDLTSAQYAARVYGHFGEQHSWFDAKDNFGNVHLASDVLKMKVQNSQDQNVGQVNNLMVDLQKGRVLYVILNAAQMVGRGDNLFALPPNAFTKGSDRNTLVTSVDKAKLEGAPSFSRGNERELANPTRAEEIYRYYGKQAYWTTGSDLSPTGRDRGNNND
jgi:sporulation protein YlmC with PRC-barrel domain